MATAPQHASLESGPSDTSGPGLRASKVGLPTTTFPQQRQVTQRQGTQRQGLPGRQQNSGHLRGSTNPLPVEASLPRVTVELPPAPSSSPNEPAVDNENYLNSPAVDPIPPAAADPPATADILQAVNVVGNNPQAVDVVGNNQQAVNANDQPYDGHEIHGLTRQAFNKFTVRFKAVKDLTLKEHMCIMRNRLHFDVMDAPMLDLKEGVILYHVPPGLNLNHDGDRVVSDGGADGYQWNRKRSYSSLGWRGFVIPVINARQI
nr:uncharacterized protein LOC117835842 [Setaria viridis]